MITNIKYDATANIYKSTIDAQIRLYKQSPSIMLDNGIYKALKPTIRNIILISTSNMLYFFFNSRSKITYLQP